MSTQLSCSTYFITDGSATPETFSTEKLIRVIEKAVEAGISMVQIREKSLHARQLFELAKLASEITKRSTTKLLINDRADIALAAGADGVHLTSRSLPVSVIRQNFPSDFIVGVSTHSLESALVAKNDGADFVVFGPVFETASKIKYGAPQGTDKLASVVRALDGFPVYALGGINLENYHVTIDAGAAGIAGISMFYEMLGTE